MKIFIILRYRHKDTKMSTQRHKLLDTKTGRYDRCLHGNMSLSPWEHVGFQACLDTATHKRMINCAQTHSMVYVLTFFIMTKPYG